MDRIVARTEGEEKNCRGNKLGPYGHRYQDGQRERCGEKERSLLPWIRFFPLIEMLYLLLTGKSLNMRSCHSEGGKIKLLCQTKLRVLFKLSTITLVKNTGLGALGWLSR